MVPRIIYIFLNRSFKPGCDQEWWRVLSAVVGHNWYLMQTIAHTLTSMGLFSGTVP